MQGSHRAVNLGGMTHLPRTLASLTLAVAGATGLAAPAAAPVTVEDSMAQRMQACTACHGKEGRAARDGYYPRIAGKPAGYLYNQLVNFRDGRRHYALMGELLAPLTDDYLHEIAGHFASLDLPYPAPKAPTGTPEERARGQRLVTQGDASRKIPACAACHGAALTGVAPAVPGLLGLPRDYLNAQLGAWRTGQRQAHAPDCMGQIARSLAPEDIGAVSHYLAAQPLPADTHPVAVPPPSWPMRCGGLPEAAK